MPDRLLRVRCGSLPWTDGRTICTVYLAAGGHGVLPAPGHGQRSWREFVRQHADHMLAVDLFTVETVWLQRLRVLFFLVAEGASPRREYVWYDTRALDPGGGVVASLRTQLRGVTASSPLYSGRANPWRH